MGRIRTLLIAAAAVACPILAGSAGGAGELIRGAAAASAGVPISFSFSEEAARTDPNDLPASADPSEPAAQENPEPPSAAPLDENTAMPETTPAETAPPVTSAESAAEAPQQSTVEITQAEGVLEGVPAGIVISRNILNYAEAEQQGEIRGGAIFREHYGTSQADDHITLSSGAQVRNMTSLDCGKLSEAAGDLPEIHIELGSAEPQVLIMHTHTTESYEPCTRGWYDAALSSRTRDSERNMVAVGEALAKELAARGVSVLHDGTIHDYPVYTGAYDRSEETVRAALEEYPSIKIVIDLHRDAIENADGSRVAPVAEINGKTAAQFMIITGCDDGRFGNMPNYMENFKLACLIQNSAEELYAGLARPVLLDYRNYNQHLSTGSLLIEVGSHANSFEEAEYTGRLLGKILGRTAEKLS